ncbi:MAG: alpha/beta fold hydrolase [Caldilineaceae bacterium]|nr:alpha/beta fold hydrolase [Caldilineaceae bacterium]
MTEQLNGTSQTAGYHSDQPVMTTGKTLAEAKAAMILLHGRGATAQSILSLAGELYHPEFAYLAPQAAGNQWYPNRFMTPIADNEPYLSAALAVVDGLVRQLGQAGIPPERIVLAGFSQGACLALEYAGRYAQRYGAVIGFSGGLIGPPGTAWNFGGSLAGTPVFLGCSDVDFHIPATRVEESAEAMRALGGDVTVRLYPGMEHTIVEDELAFARGMIEGMMGE